MQHIKEVMNRRSCHGTNDGTTFVWVKPSKPYHNSDTVCCNLTTPSRNVEVLREYIKIVKGVLIKNAQNKQVGEGTIEGTGNLLAQKLKERINKNEAGPVRSKQARKAFIDTLFGDNNAGLKPPPSSVEETRNTQERITTENKEQTLQQQNMQTKLIRDLGKNSFSLLQQSTSIFKNDKGVIYVPTPPPPGEGKPPLAANGSYASLYFQNR